MTGRRSSRGRRPVGGVAWVVLAIAAAAIAAFLVTRSGPSIAPDATNARVEHVHGLGIDPADGVLYAATHNGLFRIPDGEKATRVADRVQDTMGFTVVGPSHFLASGHPDINDDELRRAGKPPLLGLIESTDAGETWEPVSLLGEADFHALVAAHDRVYGFDATNGRFMVSADKTSWETRSEVGLASFAVDPRNRDRIVATTGDVMMTSVDGGRRWQVADGPSVLFLDWDEATGLWGLGATGEVYNDPEASGAWTQQANLNGRAEALLARGSDIYAAVMSGGATEIRMSTDRGKTWNVRYRDS